MSAHFDLTRRGFLCTSAAAALAAAPTDEEVGKAVRTALDVWKVPGAYVGVVKEEKVLYSKGHGVRDLNAKTPFDADTLYSVASCTKALASATAAVLIDEGKLLWEDPIRKHLPWFKMLDPWADREVTLRDVLCHRTGLGDVHDILYYRAPWGPEETVRRVAHLELTYPFRSRFHYCGLNYFTAGVTISAAAGKPWHQVAIEKLLVPIGIKDAVFTRAEARKNTNRSRAHLKTKDGKVVVIPWYPDDKVPDASGRWKVSGRSLLQWVKLHLAGGVHKGKRIVSEANLQETHTPQVVVRREGFFREVFPPRTMQVSHGMGWFIHDHCGHKVISHGGTTEGARTNIFFLPNEKLGFVLLGNLQDSWMTEALRDTLLDLYLGLKPTDWNAHYQAIVAKNEEKERKAKQARADKQRKGTKPSAELAEYAGTYRDSAYKDARVTMEGKALHLAWSNFKAELRHYNYDTFVATGDGGVNVYNENPLDTEMVSFRLDAEGQVNTMELYGRLFQRVRP